MFIVPLSTIANIWKQCKHPSTDEWVKKIIYTNKILVSHGGWGNEIMPLSATWMDAKMIMLSEVSQRKINTVCCCLHVESKIRHE